jgi:hypothetical protein
MNIHIYFFIGAHHHRHHKNDVASVDLSSFYMNLEDDESLSNSIMEASSSSRNSRPMTSLGRPTTSSHPHHRTKKQHAPSTGNSFDSSTTRDRDHQERFRKGF